MPVKANRMNHCSVRTSTLRRIQKSHPHPRNFQSGKPSSQPFIIPPPQPAGSLATKLQERYPSFVPGLPSPKVQPFLFLFRSQAPLWHRPAAPAKKQNLPPWPRVISTRTCSGRMRQPRASTNPVSRAAQLTCNSCFRGSNEAAPRVHSTRPCSVERPVLGWQQAKAMRPNKTGMANMLCDCLE